MKTITEVMQEICKCIEAEPGSQKAHSLEKAVSVLSGHQRIAFSISGGSDSDTILDLYELLKPYLWGSPEVRFVFFDTGLEYEASKRHLEYLGITIDREKPRKSIVTACNEHGVPFFTKAVSEMMNMLQMHNFDWLDASEVATAEKYGKCESGLKWWFHRYPANVKPFYTIRRHRLLREFIMLKPPFFTISAKCCDYAKKYTSDDYIKKHNIDLVVMGMRKAESGRRAVSVNGCFSLGDSSDASRFNPLLYWTDADKAAYKKWRNIRYSDCYEVYGMKRTGCAGCPFNSKAEDDLKKAEPFEPQLVKAARNIFADSYEYKRQYIEFKNRRKG